MRTYLGDDARAQAIFGKEKTRRIDLGRSGARGKPRVQGRQLLLEITREFAQLS